ncbi:MAG: hypothetical protein FWG87_01305 [Defluviitaleaceae bacterium]|nr:hypothetical protein [Defluviitaleaceae bacterium]
MAQQAMKRRFNGFKSTPEKIRENPLNPRKSAFHAFTLIHAQVIVQVCSEYN